MKLWLLFATLGACLSAQAGTLVVTNVDFTRGGMIDFKEDGVVANGYAGVITGTYDGTTITPLFCVDLFTNISLGTYTSNPYFPRTWRNEDRAAWLYSNYASSITSAVLGEAFQLAIWDIIHDGGDGTAGGRVAAAATTPQAVIDAWNNYVTLSLNKSSNSGTIYVNFNGTTPEQNLIGAGQSFETVSPVPEPSTASIAGLGVAFLIASRIRRERPAA